MRNVKLGDRELVTDSLSWKQEETPGDHDPELKVRGVIFQPSKPYRRNESETIISLVSSYNGEARVAYRTKFWNAELEKVIKEFLKRESVKLTDAYRAIADAFVDKSSNALLRRRVEDDLRKHPEKVAGVAEFMRLVEGGE